MRRLALLLLLLAASAFGQELEIHLLDVGQGDAVLIRGPDGRTALYDGGPSGERLLAHLERLGVERLDLVVASHADFDHIAGLVAAVARYRPAYYMDNGLPHATRTYERLLDAVEAAGSLYLEPTARTLELGEVRLHVLPPPGDPFLGQNDNSVGLVVEYGDFRAALAGDAEAAQFAWWDRHHPERLVDVALYKSSHHGSENGDTPLSVDRFRPDVVVIGVGADNPNGHPSAWARRLYEAVGAEVLRTDVNGTVVARAAADGGYRVEADRAGAPAGDAPLARAAAPSGAVAIECVLFDPDGADDGREVVALRAREAVRTDGWSLEDEAGHRFALPDAALAAGEELAVPNRGRPAWNNDGDVATLRDARGAVVDRFAYAGSGSVACR